MAFQDPGSVQGSVKLKVVPREDSATGALCCADIFPDQSDSLAMAELLANGQSEATPDAVETALESGVAAKARLRTVVPDSTSVLVQYSSHKVPDRSIPLNHYLGWRPIHAVRPDQKPIPVADEASFETNLRSSGICRLTFRYRRLIRRCSCLFPHRF